MLAGRPMVMWKLKLPGDSACIGIRSGRPRLVPIRIASAPTGFPAGPESAVNVTRVPGVAVPGVTEAVDPPLRTAAPAAPDALAPVAAYVAGALATSTGTASTAARTAYLNRRMYVSSPEEARARRPGGPPGKPVRHVVRRPAATAPAVRRGEDRKPTGQTPPRPGGSPPGQAPAKPRAGVGQSPASASQDIGGRAPRRCEHH